MEHIERYHKVTLPRGEGEYDLLRAIEKHSRTGPNAAELQGQQRPVVWTVEERDDSQLGTSTYYLMSEGALRLARLAGIEVERVGEVHRHELPEDRMLLLGDMMDWRATEAGE